MVESDILNLRKSKHSFRSFFNYAPNFGKYNMSFKRFQKIAQDLDCGRQKVHNYTYTLPWKNSANFKNDFENDNHQDD